MVNLSLKEDEARYIAETLQKRVLSASKKDISLVKLQMTEAINKKFRKAFAKNKHSPVWAKSVLRSAARILKGASQTGRTGASRVAVDEVLKYLGLEELRSKKKR